MNTIVFVTSAACGITASVTLYALCLAALSLITHIA